MGEESYSSIAESSSEDSGKSPSHNDVLNDILSWDSYRDFMSFCKNFGIQFRDRAKTKGFLDSARVQNGLPTINLDNETGCVDLVKALYC